MLVIRDWFDNKQLNCIFPACQRPVTLFPKNSVILFQPSWANGTPWKSIKPWKAPGYTSSLVLLFTIIHLVEKENRFINKDVFCATNEQCRRQGIQSLKICIERRDSWISPPFRCRIRNKCLCRIFKSLVGDDECIFCIDYRRVGIGEIVHAVVKYNPPEMKFGVYPT